MISIMLFMVMAFMGASPACADVGVPQEVLYTVCLNVQGADYYDSYEDSVPAGRLSGGQKFYVWADHIEGYYQGTTDVSAGADQFEDFVYIRVSDTCSSDELVSPEIGQSTGETIHAVTTDRVNMRCGPGVGFEELDVLEKGTKVDYEYTYDTDSTWAYASAKGKRGWVSSSYLGRVKETTTQENTEATTVYSTDERSGSNRGFVIGMVLICIGAAIAIAGLVALLLSRHKSGKSLKNGSGKRYCTECGTLLPEGSRFCPVCGTPVFAAKEEVGKKKKWS